MSVFTPVLFSDDPAGRALALERHWFTVTRHPGNPKVLELYGCDVACGIPQAEMSIVDGSLDKDSAPVWRYVLDWLARFVHRPMLVVSPDGPFADLALWAAASRAWPIGALDDGLRSGAPRSEALLTSAEAIFLPRSDTVPGIAPLYERPPEVAAVHRDAHEDVVRVLLVSHRARQGLERWRVDELERASAGRLTIDVAHADAWGEAPASAHRVRDLGAAGLVPQNAAMDPVAEALFAEAARSAFAPQQLIGGYWHWRLQDHFESRLDRFDVVICSGGCFDFAHYAQRKWYARTVLDYHEPLTAAREGAARDLAAHWEADWNLTADAVLSGPLEPSESAALLLRLGDHSYRPTNP